MAKKKKIKVRELFETQMWFRDYIVEFASKRNPIVCWWSGGVTSAVACWLAIQTYGVENCIVLMLDTKNEHADTERFRLDCEKWFGTKVFKISTKKFASIREIWINSLSLNVATGAICSTETKFRVREQWQRENNYSFQVFGYDADEFHRARGMKMNHPKSRPLFPLLYKRYSKPKCIEIVEAAGIEVPETYKMGFSNNNCFDIEGDGGCTQGGMGYWQKIGRDFPVVYDRRADLEHLLSRMKGQPVAMLRDQSNAAKESGNDLIFLKHNPEFPHVKDLSMYKTVEVKPIFECNGFCGTNDLAEPNPTEFEINYEKQSIENDENELKKVMELVKRNTKK